MFNVNETDERKAVSIGFGVFMGIVPVWGFQMAIALLLSFLFRLNKSLVIIAANISLPPLIPFILYLSHFTGKIWMGKQANSISFDREITLDLLQNSLMQYVLGAITLAITSGMFFGLLTYSLLKVFKKHKVEERGADQS